MSEQKSDGRALALQEILRLTKEVKEKVEQLPNEENEKCTPEERKKIKAIVKESKQDIQRIIHLVERLSDEKK